MRYVYFIIRIIEKFLDKLRKDCVSAYAAQAAFFIILSVFPFCMFLLTLVQYLPLTEQDLIQAISASTPNAVSPFLLNIVSEIYSSSVKYLPIITAITAIWSSSMAFYSLIYGLNSVYGVDDSKKNYFAQRILASIYTVLFAVLLLVSLSILVFGNQIALTIQERFPALNDIALLVISIRTVVSMCILVIFFLYLYLVIPNRKSHILDELPGAILTSIGWIGFSYMYSFYIDHLANISNTYGSLSAIVLVMLWLYTSMYILLIGAEINVLWAKFSKKRKKTVR